MKILFAGWLVASSLVSLSADAAPVNGATPGKAAPTAAIADAKPASWAGTYVYTESAGSSAGGSSLFLSYELVIPPSDSPARLNMQGYQTDETLLVYVVPDDKGIALKFLSYADGGSKNRYGVSVYPPDQPLLAFERTEDDTLITRWLGLKPIDSKAPLEGESFKRQ